MLCEDQWHPLQIPRAGLGALTGTEFTFDWIENAEAWSPGNMLRYKLVILAKSNNVSASDNTGWMTASIQAAFSDYVRKGNGLLAIHSGAAGYEQMPVLRSLLRGVFTHHPEQCLVTMTPHVGHPLSIGCAPFTLQVEHYFMALDDPQVDVFMTTTSVHNVEVWLHPSFQILLLNTLRWCGKVS